MGCRRRVGAIRAAVSFPSLYITVEPRCTRPRNHRCFAAENQRLFALEKLEETLTKNQKTRRFPAPPRRSSSRIASLLVAVAVVSISFSAHRWLRTSSPSESTPPAPDESLYRRLLQATVCIASEGDAIRGCGVLVDRIEKLAVTIEGVIGDRESVSTCLGSASYMDAQGFMDASARCEIAAKVVYRDPEHRLVLLCLEKWPEAAAVLPLGEWAHSPGQTLHAVYHNAPDSSAQLEWSWSFGCGRVRQILMPPHY